VAGALAASLPSNIRQFVAGHAALVQVARRDDAMHVLALIRK
jgi:hypothetical protein